MDIYQNATVDENGCWIWNKSFNSSGYGQLTVDGKYWTAHRYSYFLKDSSLKDEDVVRHKCHNRKCCNPDHLLKGTHKDNWKDSEAIHRANSAKMSKTWVIEGVAHSSLENASRSTGIHHATILKYTKDGVFDTTKYREGCKRARKSPKI